MKKIVKNGNNYNDYNTKFYEKKIIIIKRITRFYIKNNIRMRELSQHVSARFKFDLDAWKSSVPPSTVQGSSEKSAPTPLEWALQQVVKMKSEYGYSIHSLSSWPTLPFLHQPPELAQKGVQLQLKGSKRDWETGWRMTCWTHYYMCQSMAQLFQRQKQKK